MGFDPTDLRAAFGAYMTGVTVVTARDANGRDVGFTANSFTSVSLNPPMILVCPGNFLSSYEVFQNCTHFAVSILSEGQEDVANTFARFKGDRFAQVSCKRDGNGVQVICDAAATFSCSTASATVAGDHTILVGQVTEFTHSGERGLGYVGGRFFSLGLEAAEMPETAQTAIAGVIVERGGHVWLMDDGTIPQIALKDRGQLRGELAQYLADAGLTAELGQVYSVYTDGAVHHTYLLAQADPSSEPNTGKFIAIDQLHRVKFSSAHHSMMTRFALEHRTQSFGLYVGDATGGDVHR